MNIVILNECFLSESHLADLRQKNQVSVFNVTSNAEQAKERIKDAEIIFADQFVCPLGNDVLDAAPNLKLLILNTTSYHLVDLEYLRGRNIAVCNTPDFCSDSVGELVFVYILSLMRKVMLAYADNGKTPFEIFPDAPAHRKYVGNNLSQKTLGVIGLGNIGQKVCSIAQGFDMKVLGYNRSQKDISEVAQVELNELLAQSDVIVITIPYNEASHHLIDGKNMKLMKKGVVIVNISSQDILEEKPLIEALQSNRVGGYGLDNFTNKDKSHFFYNSENVMILPHLGFFSEESLGMIGKRMMEGYRGFLEGKEVHRVV